MARLKTDEHLNIEDDVFGPLNRLTRMLHDHDERGLILSLAAFAEEALGRLIEAFMLPVAASKDLLTGFNAPLGTFSSRIKASYALGLINEEQFKDLEYLRKIRNEFAHAWEHVSLEQDKLASYARNMSFSYLDENFPETSVNKVRSSISALLAEISSMTQQIHVKGAQVKVTGTRLIPLTFRGEFPVQIQQTRESLERIRTYCNEATGERKRFWVRRLELFKLQLGILMSQVPREMKPELMILLADAEKLSQ
jgi:DNA-binding MltR family transcriptional regulator